MKYKSKCNVYLSKNQLLNTSVPTFHSLSRKAGMLPPSSLFLLPDQNRLAALVRKLSRKALEQVCQAFSPDTLIRWHRNLIARKYDGSKCRKMGRPQISEDMRNAIIKIAKGNRDWGYTRIRGQRPHRAAAGSGQIVCQERLGGLLKFYRRAA